MTDPYEEFERKCRAIRRENSRLLKGFEGWLKKKGLSEKTVKKHVTNIDFYLNHCLCYDDPPQTAAEGINRIGYFLGYWFIRKAMWASPAEIRDNAAGLKKFYAYMTEKGLVSREDLGLVKEEIKAGLPEWIATVQRYDDPDTSIEDVWQI